MYCHVPAGCFSIAACLPWYESLSSGLILFHPLWLYEHQLILSASAIRSLINLLLTWLILNYFFYFLLCFLWGCWRVSQMKSKTGISKCKSGRRGVCLMLSQAYTWHAIIGQVDLMSGRGGVDRGRPLSVATATAGFPRVQMRAATSCMNKLKDSFNDSSRTVVFAGLKKRRFDIFFHLFITLIGGKQHHHWHCLGIVRRLMECARFLERGKIPGLSPERIH